jgi:hypothetical protein
MKQQFTPTPLCDVNGVKWVVKRQNALVILLLHNVCICNFTLVYYISANFDSISTLIWTIFQHNFDSISTSFWTIFQHNFRTILTKFQHHFSTISQHEFNSYRSDRCSRTLNAQQTLCK